jgi:putative transposase
MHVNSLAKTLDIKRSCKAFAVPRATYYRLKNDHQKEKKDARKSPLALSEEECNAVLSTLYSDRFVDKSPGEVYNILLDENVYICSERTMYRLLQAKNETRDRRHKRGARHHYKKPELLATGPNQVWSWDITKLKGPRKWSYFYLYVILDIYSRYIVGWIVADRESSELAKKLFEQTCKKQQIKPDQLTVHADRGAAMKSKPVAFLLADLGVTKTHNRPYTSNDNPFSESQFKTLKYCPEFPESFGCIEDAQSFLRGFVSWYNNEHRHSGINRLTPESLHYGKAEEVLKHRNRVLAEAFARTPKRFKNKMPDAGEVPTEVWINKPHQEQSEKCSVLAKNNVALEKIMA